MAFRLSPFLALAAAFVFGCALAFYLAFSDYGFHREDEGALLLQFWRWSTGDTPYRDFHVGYTPGVYFVHKTLMEWFGPGLMPGRHLLAIVNSVSACLLFLLTVRMTRSWTWALLAPLLFLGAVPVHPGEFAAFNIPYPTWYNLLLFALSATLLPSVARLPRPALLVVAGLLAGAGFTFKPNVGLFQLAASALVCLLGYGRPGSGFERGLWWAWWLAILAGLLLVFATTPSAIDLAGFLAPTALAAVAVARDAGRRPDNDGGISLLGCGLALSTGFFLVCTPWLAWSFSILGPDWFARRALFLGAGFESVYHISPPLPFVGLASVVAGIGVWHLPSWLDRRGRPAWRLPLAACLGGVVVFAGLVATRPMPEGVYAAVMNVAEHGFYTAATLVQWSMLLLWLGRPARREDGQSRVIASTTICGLMLYLQIFPRTDLMHWVAAAPLLFPSACWLMKSLSERWSNGTGPGRRRTVAVTIALPIAALALFRIGHFLDARWDVDGTRIVRTPETRLEIPHAPLRINVGRAEVYRDLEATVEHVTSHSEADDVVFTFPALDYISYFALRKPGNRHGYYFPGWPGHETEAEVLAFLAKRPPRLVVTLHEHQLYFSVAPTYYFLFADFFQTRFARAAKLGPYTVLEPADRNAATPAEAAAGPQRPEDSQAGPVAEALDAGTLSALENGLASDDSDVRLQAVSRVGDWMILGDFAPLRRALDDPDADVRSAAVHAVARTRSPVMRNALLAAVVNGRLSTTDSILAIRAASVACDESCVPLLLPLVGRDDREIDLAARGILGDLPLRRWQSDFWWGREERQAEPFAEPALARLRTALASPEAEHELRILAFAFADRLGLGACPEILRQWSRNPRDPVLPDFTVVTARNHLSRQGCEGPWLEDSLDWFSVDPTLSPRIVLREAARGLSAPDEAALAALADSRAGNASALAQWICGLVGGRECLAAARSTLASSPDEGERVAAAWSWAQLARDQPSFDELLETAASDSSPQVRETAHYGLQWRKWQVGQVTKGT